MRDVVTYDIVYEEHREPDAYDWEYEVYPVVLKTFYLACQDRLYQGYQRVQYKCCHSGKYTYEESQDKNEFLVADVPFSPGQDAI